MSFAQITCSFTANKLWADFQQKDSLLLFDKTYLQDCNKTPKTGFSDISKFLEK